MLYCIRFRLEQLLKSFYALTKSNFDANPQYVTRPSPKSFVNYTKISFIILNIGVNPIKGISLLLRVYFHSSIPFLDNLRKYIPNYAEIPNFCRIDPWL